MSQLADLLATRAKDLLRRWLQRLPESIEDGFESQLIAHAPELLQELGAALQKGQTRATARTPGRQRYRPGFSLRSLVRETALLSACIVDLAEQTGTAVTLAELRVLNTFIANTVDEAVNEHDQHSFALRKRQSEFEQLILGVVSHDLRNPLSAIQLCATLLSRSEDLDAPTQRTAARIQSSARRAARLVSDLLDFTQVHQGGGIRITPLPTDLHAVTQAVVEEVVAAYPTRKVEAVSEGNGKGYWDADRIGQVVQNLVSNALKYSTDGTPIRIVTRGEGDSVTLSVHNQGEPIPAEWLENIFQPMQRPADAVDKTSHSAGLGLCIVQSIVEAHHGRIGVTSTANAGTTFTMWLPRKAGVRCCA